MLRVAIVALLLTTTALLTQCSRSAPTSGGIATQQQAPNPVQHCPPGLDESSKAQFKDYVIRTLRTDADSCLEVVKAGRPVYVRHEDSGIAFQISNSLGSGGDPNAVPIGTDVTGEGKPDVIVTEWSGGAHCCFTVDVFELGPSFRVVGSIEAGHSDEAYFADVDHDGRYEYVGNDWAFAYWKASFAASPSPKIVLQYHAGQFEIAPSLMRTPKPSVATLANAVKTVRSSEEWGPKAPADCVQDCGLPPALWGQMLDLLYGGHPAEAWQFLDAAWPATRDDKAEFVGQFCKELMASNYWPGLMTLTGPCPPAK